MSSAHGEFGTGILCDFQGRLDAIVQDDLGLCRGLRPGASFAQVAEGAGAEIFRQFLNTLLSRKLASHFLIDVQLETGMAPVYFAGSLVTDGLLIVAAYTREQVDVLHSALLRGQRVEKAIEGSANGALAGGRQGGDPDPSWFFDEFMRLNNELVNVQRALAKSNAELGHMNRVLEQKNQEKSRFLRSFGHETRTPLNAILSVSGLLLRGLDGALTPGQRKQVELIRESAQHMLILVNDLLDLSKVEAGIIDVSPRDLDVEALLNSVAATVRTLVDDKGLEFSVAVAEGLPPLRTDFKLCRQLLLNLLSNAIKYTERGAITLSARSLLKDKESYLQVDVCDTGIGIPEDKLDAIFDEFTQVHEWGDERRGGGLGLAIARKIIEVLGGEIEVESALGKGSRFSVVLPFGGPPSWSIAPPLPEAHEPGDPGSIFPADLGPESRS